MLRVIMLSVIMLRVIILNVMLRVIILCHYAECCYTECCYAECYVSSFLSLSLTLRQTKLGCSFLKNYFTFLYFQVKPTRVELPMVTYGTMHGSSL
jgi:hypothetical protein